MRRNGLFIVLLGPDGTGKSTVAAGLKRVVGPHYQASWAFHWRPGLLPKLGGSRNSAPTVAAAPSTATYGVAVSLARFAYYLVDFIVGYWFCIRPRLAKSTLVIGERWYDDIIVHPQRYAFRLPAGLLRAARRWVPKPDLTVLLTADAQHIHARKPELDSTEIERQLRHFSTLLPAAPHGVTIATDIDPALSLALLQTNIAALESYYRSSAKDQSHDYAPWRLFPSARKAKIAVGAEDTVSNALALYQPYSVGGRALKGIMKTLPDALARTFLPRSGDRMDGVDLSALCSSLAGHLNDNAELVYSVHRGTPSRHRKMTVQLSRRGNAVAYAKVSYNPIADALIENEAKTLMHLKELTIPGVLFPQLIISGRYDETHHFILQSAPDFPLHRRSTSLDAADIALQSTFARRISTLTVPDFMAQVRSTCLTYTTPQHATLIDAAEDYLQHGFSEGVMQTCFSHGDYAPWNTFTCADGTMYVIDWEYADPCTPLFFDILHWENICCRLLKKASPQSAAAHLKQTSTTAPAQQLMAITATPIAVFSAYVVCYSLMQIARDSASYGAPSAYSLECLSALLEHRPH